MYRLIPDVVQCQFDVREMGQRLRGNKILARFKLDDKTQCVVLRTDPSTHRDPQGLLGRLRERAILYRERMQEQSPIV
jgi:hypothetical protein